MVGAEHPFLVPERDFGVANTRYRGIAKNLNHLHVLFASPNWLMRVCAVAPGRVTVGVSRPETAKRGPELGLWRRNMGHPWDTRGPGEADHAPPHTLNGSLIRDP